MMLRSPNVPSCLALFGLLVHFCFVALAVSWPNTAFADEVVPKVISPLVVQEDPNGVNVATGKIVLSAPGLSVPAAPRLVYDAISNLAPYMVTDAEVGGLDGDADRIVTNVSIHSGSRGSESFRCPASFPCENLGTSGSMFEPVLRILRKSGTGETYKFNEKYSDYTTPGSSSSPGHRQTRYYLTFIAYPDGERISYAYDKYAPQDFADRTWFRPNKVSSSTGYYLTFTYKVAVSADYDPNWFVVTGASLFKSGSTSPLLQLTYADDGTVTDIAGRVFVCGRCNRDVGGGLEVTYGYLKRPGENGRAEEVLPVSSQPMVAAVNRDGVGWNYSYTNVQPTESLTQKYYDRVQISGPVGFARTYVMGHVKNTNMVTDVVETVGAQTRTTHYDYQAHPTNAGTFLGNMTKITFPEGNSVEFAYDDYANIVNKITRPKPGPGSDLNGLGATLSESAAFDPQCSDVKCYRPISFTDARGRTTSYTYNSAGQITEQDEPADQLGMIRKTIVDYDPHPVGSLVHSRKQAVHVCIYDPHPGGASTTCGTPQEDKTEYEYWGNTFLPSLERRWDQVNNVALVTTFSYDDAGRLIATDRPNPGTDDATYARYDQLGRKTWELGAVGEGGLRLAKHMEYRDSDDKIVTETTGTIPDANAGDADLTPSFTVVNTTATAYDARRNPIRVKQSAAGNLRTYLDRKYDLRNRVECETVRMDPASFNALPAADDCTLTSAAGGVYGPDRITHNIYDTADQLLAVQKAYGTSLQQDYVRYTYTLNGKQETVTDANGNVAKHEYDAYDRLKAWKFPSRTAAGSWNDSDYEAYVYDEVGNRTSFRRRDGRTLQFAYDSLNRLIQKTVPDGCTTASLQVGPCPGGTKTYDVYYAYDEQNAQLYARYGGRGNTADGVTSSYDAFGRLATQRVRMSGMSRLLTYSYDADGNRTRITHPDGYFFDTAYNGRGQPTVTWQTDWTTIDSAFYDALGQRRERFNFLEQVNYDLLGRLTGITAFLPDPAASVSLAYTRSPSGQIATFTRTNNAPDAYRFTSYVNANRNYQVNGLNQYTQAGSGTSFTYDKAGNLSGDGAVTFGYDAENRLITTSDGADLTYDPLGRLWQITKGSVTRQFLYDGDQLVAEYDGTGAVTNRYMHGPNDDDPLVWYPGRTVANRRLLHADHEGSIIAVTDASGAVVGINAYDEYGIPNNTVDANGAMHSTNTGTFQYTGQAWFDEIGMYYYKARIYSPKLGRFLQVDPVGYDDQINLYAYVGNDPVNDRDPSGKQRELSYEDQRRQTAATMKVAQEHPTAAKVTVAVGLLAMSGGTVAVLAPEIGEALAARSLARMFSKEEPPTRGQVGKWAEKRGFERTRSDGGPVKFKDSNGVSRVTIKEGSARAPGSNTPHAEFKGPDGQRFNPRTGEPVNRRSPDNHTPLRGPENE